MATLRTVGENRDGVMGVYETPIDRFVAAMAGEHPIYDERLGDAPAGAVESVYADGLDATSAFVAAKAGTTPRISATTIQARWRARLRPASSVKVAWSDGYNMTALVEDQPMTVPDDLVPSGGSVIFAEVEYDYSSQLGYFFTTKKTLSDEFYLRPRRTDFVARVRG